MAFIFEALWLSLHKVIPVYRSMKPSTIILMFSFFFWGRIYWCFLFLDFVQYCLCCISFVVKNAWRCNPIKNFMEWWLLINIMFPKFNNFIRVYFLRWLHGNVPLFILYLLWFKPGLPVDYFKDTIQNIIIVYFIRSPKYELLLRSFLPMLLTLL